MIRRTYTCQGITITEWTISEWHRKAGILFIPFDSDAFLDYERYRLSVDDDYLKDVCKMVYKRVPSSIHKIFKMALPIDDIDKLKIDSYVVDYWEILYGLIYCNRISEYIVKRKPPAPRETRFDEYDTLIDIIKLDIWHECIDIVNYKDQLTMTELEWLSNRVSNYKRREQLAMYQSMISAIGECFGDVKSENRFYNVITAPDFDKGETLQKHDNRRIAVFQERCHDIDFIIETCIDRAWDNDEFLSHEDCDKLGIPYKFDTIGYNSNITNPITNV